MKFFTKKRAIVGSFGAGSVLLGHKVMAAVPADVTTAMTDAKDDVITIGGAVLVVLVSIAGFKYLRRSL